MFRAPNGTDVLFVEQRIKHDDGEKSVLPWSFWSTGRWYQVEPDGLLPVFGLEQVKIVHTVFLHEGAKAARDVRSWWTRWGPPIPGSRTSETPPTSDGREAPAGSTTWTGNRSRG